MELSIRKTSKGYVAQAIDGANGEIASISGESHDKQKGEFAFAAYWSSTGRFTRYRMRVRSTDKVEVTYTHTDSEILIRK